MDGETPPGLQGCLTSTTEHLYSAGRLCPRRISGSRPPLIDWLVFPVGEVSMPKRSNSRRRAARKARRERSQELRLQHAEKRTASKEDSETADTQFEGLKLVPVDPTPAQLRRWKALPGDWRLAIRALLDHFADLEDLVTAARGDGDQNEYTVHSLLVGPGALDEEFIEKLQSLLRLLLGGLHNLGRQVMRSHGMAASLMAQELRCKAVDKHLRRVARTDRIVETFIARELMLWLGSNGVSYIVRSGQVERKLPSLTLDQEIAELEATSRRWRSDGIPVDVLNYHLLGRRLKRDLPEGELSEEERAEARDLFEQYQDVELVLPSQRLQRWQFGLGLDELVFQLELVLRPEQSPLSLLDGAVEYQGLCVKFSLSRITGELCPLGFSVVSLRDILPQDFHDALRHAMLMALDVRFDAGDIEEALPEVEHAEAESAPGLDPVAEIAELVPVAFADAPPASEEPAADGALRLPWVTPKQMRRALARAGAIIRPGGRHFKAFHGEHSTAIYGVHSAHKLLSPPQQRGILAALHMPVEQYARCLRGRLLRLIKRGS